MSLVKVAVISLNEPVFKMRKNIDDAIDFAKHRATNQNMTASLNKLETSQVTRNAFKGLKDKLVKSVVGK